MSAGIPREPAIRMALKTIRGAEHLMRSRNCDAAESIRAVASTRRHHRGRTLPIRRAWLFGYRCLPHSMQPAIARANLVREQSSKSIVGGYGGTNLINFYFAQTLDGLLNRTTRS